MTDNKLDADFPLVARAVREVCAVLRDRAGADADERRDMDRMVAALIHQWALFYRHIANLLSEEAAKAAAFPCWQPQLNRQGDTMSLEEFLLDAAAKCSMIFTETGTFDPCIVLDTDPENFIDLDPTDVDGWDAFTHAAIVETGATQIVRASARRRPDDESRVASLYFWAEDRDGYCITLERDVVYDAAMRPRLEPPLDPRNLNPLPF